MIDGKNAAFPLTPNQRMVLDMMFAPDTTETSRRGWILPFAMLVKPRVDERRLRRAVATITEAHEALRTRFEQVASTWRAVLEPRHPTGLPVEDIGEVDDDQLARLIEAVCAAPLDLVHDPLFDPRLFRLGDRGDLILLRVHHIIVDGWSLVQLVEEMLMAYAGAPRQRDPGLSTAEFHQMLRTQKARGDADAAIDHWRSVLEPWIPHPDFGRQSRGIPLNRTGGFAAPRKTLSASVNGAAFTLLARQAEDAGITMNATVSAAFAQSIAAATNLDETYVATLIPQRTHHRLERYINYLAAIIPIRVPCDPAAPLDLVAKHTRDQLRSALQIVDLNYSYRGLFDGVPAGGPGPDQLPVASGLMPGFLAQRSPLLPLLMNSSANAMKLGPFEITRLPVAAGVDVSQEIGLRSMATQDRMDMTLGFETVAFTREQAEGILDDMMVRLGVSRPAGGHVTGVEHFGHRDDERLFA